MLVHLVLCSGGNRPGRHSTNRARKDQPRGTDLPPEIAALSSSSPDKMGWEGKPPVSSNEAPSSPDAGCIYSVRCCLADTFLFFLISEVSFFPLSTWTADQWPCRKPPQLQHQMETDQASAPLDASAVVEAKPINPLCKTCSFYC